MANENGVSPITPEGEDERGGEPGKTALALRPAPADGTSSPGGQDDASDPGAGAGPGAGPAGPVAVPSLSPSRASDFLTCPLLYRFRVIDRLPEPPSPAAARGTLVHAVLERLFDEPAASRTPETAKALLAPQWDRLTAAEPALAELFDDDAARSAWLAEASVMLDRYFTLEDPTRLEPSHRELAVEAMLDSGLLVRGFIDRLDVAASGAIRIVDYKTGASPREEYIARALFQMKFYAVALWLTRRQVPKLLQLIYLGNGEIVRYAPDEADLRATIRKIEAVWQAIQRARATGDWRHRPSRLCEWCAHQAICPAFGGTPPPLPAAPARAELDAAELAGAELAVTELAAPELTVTELAGPELAAAELAGPELAGAELAGPERAGPELAPGSAG